MKKQQVENYIKLTLRLTKLAFEQGISPPTYQFDTEDHILEFFYKQKTAIFWLEGFDVRMLIVSGNKSTEYTNPTDTEIALELSFLHDKRRG